MFIGYLKLNIFIPHCRSLKDKRQVVKSVKARVRNNFNVSIAERPCDKWQSCEFSFTCVNYTKDYVNGMIDRVEDYVRNFCELHIVGSEKEVL